jgi:hypothetical protein
MKTDPKYGYYPHWPQDGNGCIHPEDVQVAAQMIPSQRVWRRDGRRGDFVVLHYGDVRLRVRPTLWIDVAWEGFDVGDWVEVLSRLGHNTPRTGRIREMLWDPTANALRYQITEGDVPIPNLYVREDLRPVEPIRPPS